MKFLFERDLNKFDGFVIVSCVLLSTSEHWLWLIAVLVVGSMLSVMGENAYTSHN